MNNLDPFTMRSNGLALLLPLTEPERHEPVHWVEDEAGAIVPVDCRPSECELCGEDRPSVYYTFAALQYVTEDTTVRTDKPPKPVEVKLTERLHALLSDSLDKPLLESDLVVRCEGDWSFRPLKFAQSGSIRLEDIERGEELAGWTQAQTDKRDVFICSECNEPATDVPLCDECWQRRNDELVAQFGDDLSWRPSQT